LASVSVNFAQAAIPPLPTGTNRSGPIPGVMPAHPGNLTMIHPGAPAADAGAKPLQLLVWDSLLKEQTPLPGQATANFVFNVTNSSDETVVITDVHTSCGCTVAKLPSKPWPLGPHTNGSIDVSVNLAGKFGTFFKTITVYATNDQKILTIKVTMPENPAMMRVRNQQISMGDATAIFRGDCAKCHVEPAKGKMGKALYMAACAICHDANPRATMVSDLHNLKHPTDLAFWKDILTNGKPRTMMPPFSDQHGGPLTAEQIDSLAKVLNEAFPSMASQSSITPLQHFPAPPPQFAPVPPPAPPALKN
jgi:hypothetical protein